MQPYPIDIHIHRLPSVPGEAIVCCQPDAFCPQEDGWYAVGIHPWWLEEYDWADAAFKAHFEALVRHPRVLAVGEVGLTGEIRRVAGTERRIRDAANLGFTKFVVPKGKLNMEQKTSGIIQAATLEEALNAIFN